MRIPRDRPVRRESVALFATVGKPEQLGYSQVDQVLKGYLQAGSAAWTCDPSHPLQRLFFDNLEQSYQFWWRSLVDADNLGLKPYQRSIDGHLQVLLLNLVCVVLGIPSWLRNCVFFRTRLEIQDAIGIDERIAGLRELDKAVDLQQYRHVQVFPNWSF